MAIDFFLVKNPLTGKKGYIAQTLHGPTVGSEQLVDRMAEANTTLSRPDIRGVLSLLEETVLAALLDGRPVEIGEMLRLSPMVAGVLEGEDLRRAENTPTVRISSRVLPEFAGRFRRKAKVEKQPAPERNPHLRSLEGMDGENSALHAVYVNTVRGTDLKMKNFTLSGITLTRRPDARERVTVPVVDLAIPRYTASVLVFHFSSRFSPPDWLIPGRELTLTLAYKHERDGRTLESNAVAAVWCGLPGT